MGKLSPEYMGDLSIINISFDPTKDSKSIEGFALSVGNKWTFAKFQKAIVVDYKVAERSTMIAIDREGVILNREVYQTNSNEQWIDLFDRLISQ